MNILPKKRWHVRTKENIARVRKDEAEAAEKERQESMRIKNAEREARINLLKDKSKQNLKTLGIEKTDVSKNIQSSLEHFNLFCDFDHTVKTVNKEHDQEAKSKKEEYEKKIGYLTYLGQDTNEKLMKKNWYEVPREELITRPNNIKDTYEKLVILSTEGKPKTKNLDIKDGEISWSAKQKYDPIHKFQKVKIHPKASKKSNDRKCNSRKEDNNTKLQKLREARLKREQQERNKTEAFLKGVNVTNDKQTKQSVHGIRAKYNSQFNPHLARQNYT